MNDYYHDNAVEDGTSPTGFRKTGFRRPEKRSPRSCAEIEVGASLHSIVQGPITRTQLVKYAGASYDFNPIHYDDEYAKRTLGGGVVANGIMIMGYLGKCATAWLGTAEFDRFSARNLAMTRPGDTLLVEGRVADKLPVAGGGATVRITLKATNQATGVLVCTGEVVCTLA